MRFSRAERSVMMPCEVDRIAIPKPFCTLVRPSTPTYRRRPGRLLRRMPMKAAERSRPYLRTMVRVFFP